MKLSTITTILPLLTLPHASFAISLRGSERPHAQRTLVDEASHIMCRMTISDTLYEDGTSEELSVCVPILDLKESDQVIPFNLPLELEQVDRTKLNQGHLFVNITNAQLVDGEISVTASSEILVVDELPTHLRHLQERELQSTGELSLAIVRIVTNSRSPSISATSLSKMMDEDEINLFTQFNKCSSGKLKWKKAARPVVDVRVGNNGNQGKLIQAAQEQVVKDLNLAQITDLADRILFCVPPGTGKLFVSRLLFVFVFTAFSTTSASSTYLLQGIGLDPQQRFIGEPHSMMPTAAPCRHRCTSSGTLWVFLTHGRDRISTAIRRGTWDDPIQIRIGQSDVSMGPTVTSLAGTLTARWQ